MTARDGTKRGFGIYEYWTPEDEAELRRHMDVLPPMTAGEIARKMGLSHQRVRDKIKNINSGRGIVRGNTNGGQGAVAPALEPDAPPWKVYETPIRDFLPGRSRRIEAAWDALLAGASFE